MHLKADHAGSQIMGLYMHHIKSPDKEQIVNTIRDAINRKRYKNSSLTELLLLEIG